MVIVQSLWVGDKLSQMEQYSIKSFLNTGHEYHLYTYNKIKGIPKGVKIKSGNKIMPKKDIFKMQDTFLPFSDIFRYKLLYEKGNYWVDLDMICLKKLDFKEPFIFSSERTIQKGAYKMVVKFVPNIGVLKAPPKSEFYRELFEKCMEYHKKSKSKEKITYMRLLREMIDEYKYKKYVKPPKYFCNLAITSSCTPTRAASSTMLTGPQETSMHATTPPTPSRKPSERTTRRHNAGSLPWQPAYGFSPRIKNPPPG